MTPKFDYRRHTILPLLAALTLFLTACGSDGEEKIFTDPDKSIGAKAGDVFQIVLEEGGFVGLSWELDSIENETVVSFVSKVSVNAECCDQMGSVVYSFYADDPGTTSITFNPSHGENRVFHVTVE